MENAAFIKQIADLKFKIASRDIDSSIFSNLYEEYLSINTDLELQSNGKCNASEDYLQALRSKLIQLESEILDVEKTCQAILNE